MTAPKENLPLSANFTLFDLTRTDHADLQAENREVSETELVKLAELAWLLERCVFFMQSPIDVHSGRRFYKLNARVGGSSKSQHMLCEAADISPRGPDTPEAIEAAFRRLADAVRSGLLHVGQLILESMPGVGREGRKLWIHVSLGLPYREQARCGQILTMKDGKYDAYVHPPEVA